MRTILNNRSRKLIFRKSWDERLEDFIEQKPILAAMLFCPVLFCLIVLWTAL